MGTMIPRTKKMDKIQLNLNAHEERLHPIWKKNTKTRQIRTAARRNYKTQFEKSSRTNLFFIEGAKLKWEFSPFDKSSTGETKRKIQREKRTETQNPERE